MKKTGFVMQVVTLIIALPMLSILELNHVKEKMAVKKTGSYVIGAEKMQSPSMHLQLVKCLLILRKG